MKNRKKIFSFFTSLTLLYLIFPTIAFAETNTVGNSDGALFAYAPGHFKFTLPHYWQVIPNSTLQSYNDKIRKLYPGKPAPNYVLAIQRKALLDFTMPYALIEIDKRPMPSKQEVEAEAAAFEANIRKAYIGLYKKGLFGEVKPLPAVYDEKNNVVVGRCSMYRASDKLYITTITAMFPCRYGYVRFHFTFKTDNEEKYFPVIENIIKSVKFDDGFQFESNASNGKKDVFSRPIYIVVFVLAVIWFGFRFFGRKLQRK